LKTNFNVTGHEFSAVFTVVLPTTIAVREN